MFGHENRLNLINDRSKSGSRSFGVVFSLQNSPPAYANSSLRACPRPTFRGQIHSKPRTGMDEAKDLSFEAKTKHLKMCHQSQGRLRGLHLW